MRHWINTTVSGENMVYIALFNNKNDAFKQVRTLRREMRFPDTKARVTSKKGT